MTALFESNRSNREKHILPDRQQKNGLKNAICWQRNKKLQKDYKIMKIKLQISQKGYSIVVGINSTLEI